MEALSVREYRNNLAASFARADKGERVLIRRRQNIYALISVGKEDLELSQHLQARIAEAEKECKAGQCVTCRTPEEIESFLDSL